MDDQEMSDEVPSSMKEEDSYEYDDSGEEAEGDFEEERRREKETMSMYYYGDEDELDSDYEGDLGEEEISRLDSYDTGILQGVLDVNFEEGDRSGSKWRSDGRISLKAPTGIYAKHFRRIRQNQEIFPLPLVPAIRVHDRRTPIKVEASHSIGELEKLLQRACKLCIALLTAPCPLHSFAKMCVWIQKLRGLLHHSWISGCVSEEKFVNQTLNLVSAMEGTNRDVLEQVDAAILEEETKKIKLSEKEMDSSCASSGEEDDGSLGSLLKTDMRFLHQVCSYINPRFILGSVVRVCKEFQYATMAPLYFDLDKSSVSIGFIQKIVEDGSDIRAVRVKGIRSVLTLEGVLGCAERIRYGLAVEDVEDFKAFCHAISLFRSVEQFDFHGAKLAAIDSARFFQCQLPRNLKVLRIEHCHFDTDNFDGLGEMLKRLQGLVELSFRGTHLEPNAFMQIMKGIERHPSLQILDVSYVGIVDAGEFMTAGSLPKVHTLIIDGVSFFNAAIFQESMLVFPALKEIRMQDCARGCQQALSGFGAFKFETVIVSGSRFIQFSAVTRIISTFPALKEFDVSRISLGDAGGQELGKLIAKNTPLRVLTAQVCEIGDSGLRSIFHALARNTHLKVLDLQGNLGNMRQLGKVLHGLLDSISLEKLLISVDNMVPTHAKELRERFHAGGVA